MLDPLCICSTIRRTMSRTSTSRSTRITASMPSANGKWLGAAIAGERRAYRRSRAANVGRVSSHNPLTWTFFVAPTKPTREFWSSDSSCRSTCGGTLTPYTTRDQELTQDPHHMHRDPTELCDPFSRRSRFLYPKFLFFREYLSTATTARPTSARASATMPRSRKSATTIRRRSGRSDSNATCARVGSRSGRIRRFVFAGSGSLIEGGTDHGPCAQNTRYVVTEGARQKNEEWDPAENGQMVIGEFGFAPHGNFRPDMYTWYNPDQVSSPE